MLQWLYTYVASVCFKCFTCFKCMLQVFYLGAAYVALAIHVRCKCMFEMFQLFQTYVASILRGCWLCCKCMFVNVLSVSNVCCSKCIMLQVLHDQTREVGADGGGPLGRSGPRVRTRGEAGAVAPTCMRRRMHTAATSRAGPAGAVTTARGRTVTTTTTTACRSVGRNYMHAL
jgi:hypothetical protein